MRNSHLSLLLSITCVLGCAQTQERTGISYPYKASPQRASEILDGAARVARGMKPAQVKAILGEPDELMNLFRRSDIEQKPVGYTYWYMIRRKGAPQAEWKDPEQKLVRICSDLNDKVTSVDYWGIDRPSDNKRMETDQ